ncbi:hypothetical protein [Streptomyces sp. JJ36]|uniref:hypothetical protein n=1 Tax=Streptomyces sp. JJ36 TaxID=2736645 RepID=UPI001F256A42|nr:hypothetical protein [Streptomyces sp. JJ36]MCF6521769.1 hypothetical protein [Streptomyces sp. JJ36]
MNGTDGDLGYTPERREIGAARSDAKQLSSQLLDILNLDGKVTEPGPGVSLCEGRDTDKFFKIRHPWSVYDVPVEDMERAMEKLREALPERGWEVTSYGPDESRAKSLTLFADSTEKKFTAQVKLLDRRGRSDHPSGITVTLVSACFQVPEGQTVDEY